ncbi:MAG: nuclear transport factor 2 family protein [Neomegalonema sp.]|nr:nuclear transport factor 2 family protein [Neomegalonema sp.]
MDMNERLTRIEDDLAIRQLRARYCFLLDQRRVDEVVDLFTEDGYFQGLGIAKGRTDLRQFFAEQVPMMAEDMWHFIGNETIDIAGDRATGTTSLQYWSVKGGESYLSVGHYEEEMRREGGHWKFARKIVHLDFLTRLQDGWAGKPMHRPSNPEFLRMQAEARAKLAGSVSVSGV